MLGAVASGSHASLADAMTMMARDGEAATPPDVARFHAEKHEVYRMLQRLDRDAREKMAPFGQA